MTTLVDPNLMAMPAEITKWILECLGDDWCSLTKLSFTCKMYETLFDETEGNASKLQVEAYEQLEIWERTTPGYKSIDRSETYAEGQLIGFLPCYVCCKPRPLRQFLDIEMERNKRCCGPTAHTRVCNGRRLRPGQVWGKKVDCIYYVKLQPMEAPVDGFFICCKQCKAKVWLDKNHSDPKSDIERRRQQAIKMFDAGKHGWFECLNKHNVDNREE
ncbi:hypothetical protein LTR66_016055, partial [Elasticomyces elasticus]